jgi:hypothetical protein
MADRYWVGGTATWDGTALLKWALTSGGIGGQAVPTAADDVYFDAASGAVTITLSGARTCLSFNSTGFTGTLTGTGTLTVSANAIYGAGATFTNTGAWTFNATSGTQQITTNSKTLDFPITQNGVGGTVQLQDNLSTNSRTFTLTNGALDLNNRTLSIGVFSSSNSNIRSIAFGTGNITVTGNDTTVFLTTVVTNLTYTGTPTVNFTYAGSTGTRQISSSSTNASIANVFNFNFSAGSDSVTFGTGASRAANNVDFTGFSGTIVELVKNIYGSLTLAATNLSVASTSVVTFSATSGTKTITTAALTLDFPITFNGVGGAFAFQDALTQGSTRTFTITNGTVQLKSGVTSSVGSFATSSTNQKFLQSTTSGTQATLSQVTGIVSTGYLTIKDINATGGATFNAYTVNNNVNAGNNLGWDFFAQLGKTIFTRRKEKRVLI